MNIKQIIREIILLILTILPICYLLLNWSALPEKMPTHFDFNGEPNGYGSKTIYIYLQLGIYLLMLLLPIIDPRRKNYELFDDTYYKLRVILSLLFGAITFTVVFNVLHGTDNMGLILPLIIYLLFTLMGNYLGTVRPNYFVGIKVPWTLNSDVVWMRTHKFAGKLWFWGGLAGIASWLVVKQNTIIMIVIASILVVVPIAYSYIIYQKLAKQE